MIPFKPKYTASDIRAMGDKYRDSRHPGNNCLFPCLHGTPLQGRKGLARTLLLRLTTSEPADWDDLPYQQPKGPRDRGARYGCHAAACSRRNSGSRQGIRGMPTRTVPLGNVLHSKVLRLWHVTYSFVIGASYVAADPASLLASIR